MEKVFELLGPDTSLAKSEVMSLTKAGTSRLIGNYMVCKSNQSFIGRLAYTSAVYEMLFLANPEEYPAIIDRFDWESATKGSFCVRAKDLSHTGSSLEKDIAPRIWRRLEEPKVVLKDPDTMFLFIRSDIGLLCCRLIGPTDRSYMERSPLKRAAFHPTTMSPRLARACVNLTGILKGSILDPFCGIGGILIEAGLMGLDVTGYDIDKAQVDGAIKNMKHYGLGGTRIEVHDARKIEGKFDAIVTDLPYGKNSKGKDLANLYSDFLSHAAGKTESAVVIFPDFLPPETIVPGTGWTIKETHRIYVHKSMTKVVAVLTHSQ